MLMSSVAKSYRLVHLLDNRFSIHNSVSFSGEGLSREVIAFCRASRTWIQDPRGLDDIINHDTGAAAVSLPTLASALISHGWLGTCSDRVVAKADIGLGDIGYVGSDGQFVVVANLHAHLASMNASGGVPAWKSTRSSAPYDFSRTSTVVQGSEKAWKRQIRGNFL